MADLVQRVKYIVEVDASALTTLQDQVDKGKKALDGFDKAFKQVGTWARSADRAIANFTDKLNKNVTAAQFARAELSNLGKAQSAQRIQVDQLNASIKSLSDMFATLAKNGKIATAAVKEDTEALKKNSMASSEASRASEGQFRFLKAFGTFMALRHIAKGTFDAIKDGAQQLELDRILSLQINNFAGKLEEAKARTGGMVSTGELRRSMALMSSFGIDMERYGESMELVQKMAIRTGQSADFLTQSFAKGISRLSPLILDNLGLQVSLKDANEAYAASVGKSTEELTKHERITALMNHTLEAMKKNTEGVTLSGPAASVQRFETAVKDLWDKVKETGGVIVGGVDMLFSDASTNVARRADLWNEKIIQLRKQLADAKTDEHVAKINKELALSIEHMEALRALSRDEYFGDLFGDQGLFGTTPKQIRRAEAALKDMWEVYSRFASKPVNEWQNYDSGKSSWDDLAGGAMIAVMRKVLAEARVEFDKIKKDMAGTLSDSEFEKLWENYRDQASGAGLRIISSMQEAAKKSAEAWDGDVDVIFFQNLMNVLKNVNPDLDEMNEHLRATSQELGKNAEASKKANAEFAKRVTLLEEQTAHLDRIKEYSEGNTKIQIGYNQAKERESEVLSELQKKHEELRTAMEEGRGKEIADAITSLQTDLEKAQVSRKYWQWQLSQQDEYFKQFEKGSKAQRDAEIDRLRIMIEQIRAVKTQMSIMNAITLAASGGKISVDNSATFKILAEEIANGEAMIKRLQSVRSSYGGGSRERADRWKKPKDTTGDPRDFLNDFRKDYDEFHKSLDSLWQDIDSEKYAANPLAALFGGNAPSMTLDDLQKMAARLDEVKKAAAEGGDKYGDAFFQQFDPMKLQAIDTELGKMIEHLKTLVDIARGFDQVGSALSNAAEGMQGLFGDDITGMVTDLGAATSGFAEALTKSNDAYGLAMGAMPMVQAFTRNLIQNRRAQAGIEAAMQAAAAWAAAATGNVPGAIAHGIASAMYAGVALKVFRLPKGKERDDKPNERERETSQKRDVHIHIAGPIALTEGERGAMIRDALKAAEREGL